MHNLAIHSSRAQKACMVGSFPTLLASGDVTRYVNRAAAKFGMMLRIPFHPFAPRFKIHNHSFERFICAP
jgi:hypothetical protein